MIKLIIKKYLLFEKDDRRGDKSLSRTKNTDIYIDIDFSKIELREDEKWERTSRRSK